MNTYEKFGVETMNKFYLGAEHIGKAVGEGINAKNTRLTLEEATEDARKHLHRNPHVEACVIVKIVRVVTREEPPIKVEDL